MVSLGLKTLLLKEMPETKIYKKWYTIDRRDNSLWEHTQMEGSRNMESTLLAEFKDIINKFTSYEENTQSSSSSDNVMRKDHTS